MSLVWAFQYNSSFELKFTLSWDVNLNSHIRPCACQVIVHFPCTRFLPLICVLLCHCSTGMPLVCLFVQIYSCHCHRWGCWSLLCGCSLQPCGRWLSRERFSIMRSLMSSWRWWRRQCQTCLVRSNEASCSFDWEPKWVSGFDTGASYRNPNDCRRMSHHMDTEKSESCWRDYSLFFLRLCLQIILELCRNEETANILCIQPHLERIRPPGYTGVSVFTMMWQLVRWPVCCIYWSDDMLVWVGNGPK